MMRYTMKYQLDINRKQDIISGKINIVTRDGNPARILCWDYKGGFPIIAAVTSGDSEITRYYSYDGHTDGLPFETGFDLLMAINDSKRKFKIGDLITSVDGRGVWHARVKELNEHSYYCTTDCGTATISYDAEDKYILVEEQELSNFERALKHIIEEALEDGDTHNLKADAENLLWTARKQLFPHLQLCTENIEYSSQDFLVRANDEWCVTNELRPGDLFVPLSNITKNLNN